MASLIGFKHSPNSTRTDFWGNAAHPVDEEAVAILEKAEIIVPNPDPSWLVKYVPAPDMTWEDVVFAAKEAAEMVRQARQDHLRKRLHGVI